MRYLLIAVILLLASSAGAADYSAGGDSTASYYKATADSSLVTDTVHTGGTGGTLDSLIGWMYNDAHGPHSIAFVVYDASGNIIDSTAHFTVDAATVTRYAAAVIEGATISADTKYRIGTHAASEGGVNGGYRIRGNDAIANRWIYQDGIATIPADLSGASTTSAYDLSFRMYWSDAAAPASTTKKLGAVKLGAGKL